MANKATHILLLVVSQTVNILVVFLFTPYLVRALPQAVYGTYGQALFISELINTLCAFAILQMAMMVYSNKHYRFEDSLRTVLQFTGIAGVLGFLLCVAFSFWAPQWFDNPLLGPLLRLYSFSLLGSRLNLVCNQALIKIEKTRVVMVLSIVSNFIKLALGFYCIQYLKSIEWLMVVYAAEPIISSMIQLIILKRAGYMNGRFQLAVLRDIFQIGFPLYLVELLGASYTYISGFVISTRLNESQYAIYRNGSVEIPVIGALYGTISMIFMSDLMRHIQDRSFGKVAEAKRKIMTSTAVFIFPVAFFFIFFSREFIVLYLSEKYIDSYTVFIVFTMALLIRLQNYTDILILMKKSVYVLISFVVFMILNIGLNLWLSGLWGIVGCALATIISVYILAGMQLHFTVRQLNVRYAEYIDMKALVQILFFSVAWAGTIKWGSNQLNLPLIWQFLLAGICTVPPLVLFLIKQKFLDISALEGLFGKIPYFGHKLYRLLA